MSEYTVNELLCFATSQFDKLDQMVLNSTLLEFYSLFWFSPLKKIISSTQKKVEDILQLFSDDSTL